MRLAIMQAYFFPYIGYFQGIHAVDKYILYEHVTYRKRTWISRNAIYEIGNGAFSIGVPGKHKSSFVTIGEVLIDDSQPWRKKLIDVLQYNYKRCPFFSEVHPFITEVLHQPAVNLHEFNAKSIKAVCNYLNISTEIVWENKNYLPLEQQLTRYQSGEEHDLQQYKAHNLPVKSVRILEICKAEKADVFINAAGGAALYSVQQFQPFGVDLKFIYTPEYHYPQVGGSFLKHLSILDVLYNCGKEDTGKLIQSYQLI